MSLRITMGHCGGGKVGCRIRMGQFLIGVDGWNPIDALHAASGIAHQLAHTITSNPELQMLLPPQVQLALKAIHTASDIIKSGDKGQAAALTPVANAAVQSVLRNVL